MLRNFIYLFCLLILALPTYATQEVDESLQTNSIEVPDCGLIKIALTSWVQLYESGFIIYHPLAKDVNPTPDIQFSFKCYKADDENVVNNGVVAFNKTTKLWELSPDLLNRSDNESQEWFKKNLIVNKLEAKNTQGWVKVNSIGFGNDSERELSFCLINDKTKKALCGNGIVEYFAGDAEVTKINYEPIVLKFLKSIEFFSENKSAPCDKK